MSKNGILVTRPEHDTTVFYCSKWAETIIVTAKAKGLDVSDLKRERATKEDFEGITRTKDPKFIFFNGHGSSDLITGHNNEVLVKVGVNSNLLKEKIVYARSCDSAYDLGREVAMMDGTYIGYDNSFIFLLNPNKVSRPETDELAKPFFESSNLVPSTIIKGNIALDAWVKSQQSYDHWIAYYRLHGEELEAPQMLSFLMWDKASQVIKGKHDASIS